MSDIRFPTARQLLLPLALAEAEGGKRLSSSQLASGRGANSSFVRKLLLPLADARLVEAAVGRDGGICLGRQADKITIHDISRAVIGDQSLWVPRLVPHRGLVSSNSERYVVRLAAAVDNAVLKTLESRPLADSLAELRVMHADR